MFNINELSVVPVSQPVVEVHGPVGGVGLEVRDDVPQLQYGSWHFLLTKI